MQSLVSGRQIVWDVILDEVLLGIIGRVIWTWLDFLLSHFNHDFGANMKIMQKFQFCLLVHIDYYLKDLCKYTTTSVVQLKTETYPILNKGEVKLRHHLSSPMQGSRLRGLCSVKNTGITPWSTCQWLYNIICKAWNEVRHSSMSNQNYINSFSSGIRISCQQILLISLAWKSFLILEEKAFCKPF